MVIRCSSLQNKPLCTGHCLKFLLISDEQSDNEKDQPCDVFYNLTQLAEVSLAAGGLLVSTSPLPIRKVRDIKLVYKLLMSFQLYIVTFSSILLQHYNIVGRLYNISWRFVYDVVITNKYTQG